MAKEGTRVDVGFVDEVESWKLDSRFFPSKVGGRPAWLHLSQLPSSKEMECEKCHEPCIFLCQVYAPIEIRDDCFHRTLFVFMCRNAKCYSSNDNSCFLVLRSQLRRQNEFYPFDPPEDSENWHPECKIDKWSDVCAACGNSGSSHCGRCKKVKYCSRNHQVLHWRDHHKQACTAGDHGNVIGKSSCLLPEYELIVEPEGDDAVDGVKSVDSDCDEDDDNDEAEKARLKEFENLQLEGKAGTFAEDDTVDADLLQMAAFDEDKIFKSFKTRIAYNPGQVLRYQQNGEPLWLSDDHRPSDADIPPCTHCGSPRVFEFQILPQLLNHLSLDNVDQSIDWGILVVYTCERSCTEGPAYKREFLWKQDINA
ncbi:programmed cell death protein 2 [Thrips palmi]|uniref:Programmed cell death protein 2 n=1 Tax=Thrips palmi TaxID=161013 RepID=A0A6P8ZV70_THRPL|nr:programmed cell death protein 2 [Thrips palmi]